MSSTIHIVKRNGDKVPLNIDKIHFVVEEACKGLAGVSSSQIEMNANLQFYDGMTTKEIQEILVRSANDLISLEATNYQYAAARLLSYSINKEVFGRYKPIDLYDIIKRNVDSNVYDRGILEQYTPQEIEKLDSYINHKRDENFTYAGLRQVVDKYLVQDRSTGNLFETPQFMYMMIAATLFANYPKESRMHYVRRYYDAMSLFKVNIPTPVMAGVRTPIRQFASCVLVDSDDTLDSIFASDMAIGRYTAQRAGIGINAGRIRGVNSRIRGGEVAHTGVVPFLKKFESTVRCCTQNGVRGGSATVHFPMWHQEIEDILVLKNNKGTEDNRVRKLDYSIQLNKTMYERLINDQEITLFSPHDVPGLYEAYFGDPEEFKKLYEKYERSTSIKKKKVSAFSLFVDLLKERAETGRIYIMNVDHANTHSSFKDTVYMSNLCQEITLPTIPLQHIDDIGETKHTTVKVPLELVDKFKEVKKNLGGHLHGKAGRVNSFYEFVDENEPRDTDNYAYFNEEVVRDEDPASIALCILSAINVGVLKSLDELEELCDLAVRALEEIIDYQNYPIKAAELSTKGRRSLGIGYIGLAHYLAKKHVKYEDPKAWRAVHELSEAFQYYLLKASNNLAKERGACTLYNRTKYADGILPIDTYKKDVDEVVGGKLNYDWEALRKDILEHGLRHSTLSAQMPSESSSVVSNATNGIEPPRGFLSVKKSKKGPLKQIVPQYQSLKNYYSLLWDMPSNEGYINIVAAMQKFFDQSISGNWSYNPTQYPDNEVPMSVMINDLVSTYKLGWKTSYYMNTYDYKTDPSDVEDEAENAKQAPGPGTPVGVDTGKHTYLHDAGRTPDSYPEQDASEYSLPDDDADCDACSI